MKKKFWHVILALAFVGLMVAPFCTAQSPAANSAHLTYTDATGKALDVPVGGYVEVVLNNLGKIVALLATMAASWIGKLALQFVPAAKDPNGWVAWLVGFLKKVSVATPDRHTDVAVIEKKLDASPNNNFEAKTTPTPSDIAQTNIGGKPTS